MRLDIRPVMNLMVVLIPLLLAGSVFTKLAIKQLNLPPKSAGGAGTETEKPAELEKRLGLSIIVSKNGFYIASRSGFLKGEESKRSEGGEPTVPLNADGSYNFEGLQAKLREIKQKVIETNYSDKNAIMITAEADIKYKFLIKTMDYVTTYIDEEGKNQELFPQIIIGQVVL
ncbi:hypothetical protein B1H10_04585 [candidate division KSB1 bacterium 4484_188]|nr:MAG: hypothetical protein B1H10_04585 [candidate division KSB1 bacterium 4484_188]